MLENINNWLDLIGTGSRIPFIIVLVVGGHVVVKMLRRLSHLALIPSFSPKVRSVGTLLTSMLLFGIYFACFGLVLRELGISLATYLASASVIGLAVGFGSQGLVQDVVTGLTIIFSDVLDVDDLAEISGQTGIVRGITMRFVELENAMGARVFIPNRTINNVLSYPRQYVRCFVDVRLLGDDAEMSKMETRIQEIMHSTAEQFAGHMRTKPTIVGRRTTTCGTAYCRMKFRLWPGRGVPLETTFADELRSSLKVINPAFENWMVSVAYEAESNITVKPVRPAWRRKLGNA